MLKFIDKGINFNDLRAINGNEELIYIIRKLLNIRFKFYNVWKSRYKRIITNRRWIRL